MRSRLVGVGDKWDESGIKKLNKKQLSEAETADEKILRKKLRWGDEVSVERWSRYDVRER